MHLLGVSQTQVLRERNLMKICWLKEGALAVSLFRLQGVVNDFSLLDLFRN